MTNSVAREYLTEEIRNRRLLLKIRTEVNRGRRVLLRGLPDRRGSRGIESKNGTERTEMPIPTCVRHDRSPDQLQSKRVLPDATRMKNRLIGPREFRRERIQMKRAHQWT